eukprot:CAMPEP_0202890356 /NCGR_PEP_ID=MMETSP1392-20130828/792_1 /ASSEMBLY_ACC=CAM_ASM_000868 /TAXON_ID=225041 /ORGANISM="Chlamydomonas chlamydogama, Strain SAG 11-48b" /LENGTH=681 /DNA_ID=CAMNT_0049573911 /DNA_START=129 /DNA_END=2170 /DNA_ORIENTATION=-
MGQRLCEKSGYCSLGHSKPVYTDVAKPGQMKKLLESVAYKKEIIVTAFTQNSNDFLDILLQLHDELTKNGYAHIVALSFKEEDCIHIRRYTPDLACVWDTSPVAYGLDGGPEHLWHLRWKFMGRASRMGYNVMSIDNDIVFFDDPYRHLKAEPMASINLFCAIEGVCTCNGGFMYVQNARPDGPSTWVFKQITDVPLRWMDDDLKFLDALGRKHNGVCNKYDQSFIDDAVHSTLAGQIIYPKGIGDCWGDPPFQQGGLTKWQAQKNAEKLVQCDKRMHFVHVAIPKEWGPEIALDEEPGLLLGNITQPHAKGYPLELGGRLYAEQRGKYSGAFVAQLKDDCPDCPWWPEEAPEDEAKAAAIQEVFAIPQRWFIATMTSRLRRGYWAPTGGYPPHQVLGHAHYIAPCQSYSGKAAMRKLTNTYNWELATKYRAASNHTAYHCRKHVTRVLALSPSINLARARNHEELHQVLAGLRQVSMLTGRTMVVPDLPCETKFMQDMYHKGCFTNATGGMMLGWHLMPRLLTPPSVQPPKYAMTAFYMLTGDCLGPHHGAIFSAEFDHWLAVDAPQGLDTTPTARNTLLLPDPANPVLTNTSAPLNQTMVRLKAEDVTDAADALEEVPLVFLGHPVEVEPGSMEKEAWTEFQASSRWCAFLHKRLDTSDMVEVGRTMPAHVKDNTIYHT